LYELLITPRKLLLLPKPPVSKEAVMFAKLALKTAINYNLAQQKQAVL
jgi:hypothetical protein